MRFDDLNEDNFLIYAMKEYNNVQCTGVEEFYDDLKKIKYIKRLFNIYLNDGTTLTFADAGDSAILCWIGASGWQVIGAWGPGTPGAGPTIG